MRVGAHPPGRQRNPGGDVRDLDMGDVVGRHGAFHRHWVGVARNGVDGVKRGVAVEHAAAEFARYSRTRIEIRDPALAAEPVTGLFAASDPAGFGRAVASVLDAKVEQQGGAVILTR